jgi:hypothetical protein
MNEDQIKMVISGNCQRYPLAQEITNIFPQAKVLCLALPGMTAAADVDAFMIDAGSELDAEMRSDPFLTNQLINALSGSQVWITQGDAPFTQSILAQISPALRPRVIRIPVIGFAAFQPDTCFVVQASDGEARSALVAPVFHSTFVAWAYRRSLPTKTAASLFSDEAYAALGYFDMWDTSLSFLKGAFLKSDLAKDFDHFFLKLKRAGVFMHTFNHPHQEVMMLLAELIASHLVASYPALEKMIPDHTAHHHNILSQTNWPVYPPIANHLGLTGGSYVWQMGAQTIEGVDNFVRAMYQSYRSQAIAPGNLQILNRSLSELDRALMPCVKSGS